MAFVTGLGLALGKQVLRRSGVVVGMARSTGDIVFRVFRAPDSDAIEVCRVALEACGDALLWLHDGVRVQNCVPAAACRDVILGRAMASLAGGELRRSLSGGHALEMRVFVEVCPDSWMAGLALRIARVSRVRRNHRENRPSFRRLAFRSAVAGIESQGHSSAGHAK